MSRYSVRYCWARSGVRSGHAMRKISSSGRPVIAPTLSKGRRVPPCASMTRFAVSTTKRTLSVSVPSRSQRTARSVTGSAALRSASAATARRDNGSFDRQHGLFRELTVTRFLPTAHEIFELVVEGIGVLKTGVHDLEAQITHGI